MNAPHSSPFADNGVTPQTRPTPQAPPSSAAPVDNYSVQELELYTPPAPQQTQFTTREELLAYITDFSVAQGYAVVTHKSNLPRGQVWLRCDMGSTPRNLVPPTEAKRKRKNGSRRQNCPFQLYGRRLPSGEWVLQVQNAHHTHELASGKQDLELHPKARRLTNAQKRLVLEMTDVGIRPAVIMDRLKAKFPDKPLIPRDIYNARNYIRMERLAGRVPFPEVMTENEHDDERDDAATTTTTTTTSSAEQDASQTHIDQANEREQQLQQLQRMWMTMATAMPQWPSQKRAEFTHELQGLVDKYTCVETQEAA